MCTYVIHTFRLPLFYLQRNYIAKTIKNTYYKKMYYRNVCMYTYVHNFRMTASVWIFFWIRYCRDKDCIIFFLKDRYINKKGLSLQDQLVSYNSGQII